MQFNHKPGKMLLTEKEGSQPAKMAKPSTVADYQTWPFILADICATMHFCLRRSAYLHSVRDGKFILFRVWSVKWMMLTYKRRIISTAVYLITRILGLVHTKYHNNMGGWTTSVSLSSMCMNSETSATYIPYLKSFRTENAHSSIGLCNVTYYTRLRLTCTIKLLKILMR